MDVNKIDFEEARNKLQMIEKMLNRMPLIHGENDVFKVTADEMDDFLASVTPNMDGKQVTEQGKKILHTCLQVLKLRQKDERLTPEQSSLLADIEQLN